MLGHSAPHLFKANVDLVGRNLANDAPVTIPLVPANVNLVAEDHVGEAHFGGLAEGLSFLWRVNSGKADLVLMLFSVKDGDGIAIANRNDPSVQFGSDRDGDPKKGYHQQQI